VERVASLLTSIMPIADLITSAANPLLKDVRKALSRGGLTSDGCCVVETFHLLEEALRSRCRVRTVIAAKSASARVEELLRGSTGIRLSIVSDKLLNSTARVATSQGVVALVDPPEHTVEQTLGAESLVLVVDGLQDPGNLGTILRSAEAFGATGLLLLKGSVSPFNPKALRASAGSVFRVPFVHGMDEALALEALRRNGANLYAAVANANGHVGSSPSDADLTCPCAIIIGSEGHGVSPSMRSAARDISIPTAGVESLNAAVSAAILLYEAQRQRSRR
jgi:RNA methyltransferase, TrmH family